MIRVEFSYLLGFQFPSSAEFLSLILTSEPQMEDSVKFDAGSDQGNALVTPYYTPYPKHLLPKSGLQPVNIEFSPSSGGDNSVASMKEGPGSSSSSSSSSTDSEQERKIVGEEKTDNVSLESENRSYNELLKEFLKNKEELKLSNIKLKLSEEKIVKLNVQIEKSEGELNNVLVELKVKEENLEYEKGQVLELQKKTADLETHVPDCSLKIAKLVAQLELAEEQLKISDDEIARLEEELNSRSLGTRELQGQLEVARALDMGYNTVSPIHSLGHCLHQNFQIPPSEVLRLKSIISTLY